MNVRAFQTLLLKRINAGLLLCGFMLALALRVAIGGNDPAHSPIAGLIFASILVILASTTFPSTIVTRKTILLGLIGGSILCIPGAIQAFWLHTSHPIGNYALWALVVGIVALSEELFLRGTLFNSITSWRNETTAIIVGAIFFTVLHVPLYGWHIIPLDFVVGVWLGMLRSLGKSWTTSGIAHVFADLASWWIL